MRKTFLLFTLFLSTFVFSQENTIEIPKIVIKIPLGETIHLEYVSIKFIEVLEDSRCPKNVTCIWAGRARVLVEITEIGKDHQQKELLFGQIKQGEIIDNILFTSTNYSVKGVTLNPYPSSEEVKEIESYSLLIFIDRD